jgi:hypothetical protein
MENTMLNYDGAQGMLRGEAGAQRTANLVEKILRPFTLRFTIRSFRSHRQLRISDLISCSLTHQGCTMR